VEVKPRTRPAKLTSALPSPEQQVLQQLGIDMNTLRAYLI
jgi:hypothetical protein